MFGSPIPGLPSMSPIPASPLPSCFLLFIRCGTVKGRRELGHRKASAPLGWRLYRYATVRGPRYSRGRKIMEGPDKGISPMEMAAREIAARLRESGHVAYLAGGCVRDIVRAETPKDFDIATDAKPEIVQKIFPRCYAVGAHFGVIVVLENGFQFEVATFRSDDVYLDGRRPSEVHFSSPEEDAQRRDFTINGMFFDPVKEEVIDFVGGRADLKAKLIRAIGDPAQGFAEDRLRVLRAISFATVLEFEIENETSSALQQSSSTITEISAERIS